MNNELYQMRDYKDNDKALVMATFLRGLYYGDSWFSQIPKDIFMSNYKRVAEAIVSNPNTSIKVVCLKEDEDVIIGYSILSANYSTIHWVYVKSAFRLQGIGRALVPQFPTAVSHLSEVGKKLLPKFKNAVFNPFAIT